MKELVFKSENGNPVTTSLLVAEKFEKNHRDVLEAIDGLVEGVAEKSADLFIETSYTHPQNKQTYRMYVMNRDGFSLLVMGFTGSRALQFKLDFIEAFNKMEQIIKTSFQLPQTYADALRQLAEQVEENDRQQKLLIEQKPKVIFADAVATSTQSCLIGELAKILRQNGIEIGQNRLFDWLRANGYLCRYGEKYNQPTQKAMEMELFEVKKTSITKPNGTVLVTTTTKVTGKGQIYFVNKLIKASRQ